MTPKAVSFCTRRWWDTESTVAFVIYRASTRPAGATYAIVEFIDHSVEAIPVS